jgi:AcrR family transcriptional regulator
MSESDKNTEDLILEAAKKVFISKGMAGARMQEIADEAGINKALLHYYFRSKEKLFERVFGEVFENFFPSVAGAIITSETVFEKIEKFVDAYMDLLTAHPFIPAFIINEMNRDPDAGTIYIKQISSAVEGEFIQSFAESVRKEAEAGIIRRTDPRHLIVNMLGLCLFPVIGRPVISTILFKGDQTAYNHFLEERKQEVSDFIIHSIKKYQV